MAGKNYGVFRRRPDYLRHIRRVKPITIAGRALIPVLRFANRIYGNRTIYRRRIDYLRHTRRIMPITITAPPAPIGGNLYYYMGLMGDS